MSCMVLGVCEAHLKAGRAALAVVANRAGERLHPVRAGYR